MKIRYQSPRRNRDGSAVIVMITVLSILLIFVAGNIRTLHLLRSDLRFIENQQVQRLEKAILVTNSIAPIQLPK